MILPVFLFALASQDPLSLPMNVADPNRIAKTPTLDGKIDEEEWDPLVHGDAFRSFMQWQPEKLHFAARIPAGHDLLISLDAASNGWLVGQDNIEVRIRRDAGLFARRLNARAVGGPEWVAIPSIEQAAQVAVGHDVSSLASAPESSGWFAELTLQDPGIGLLPGRDGRVAVRVEAVPALDAETPPHLPRALTQLHLVTQRGSALPEGLRWGVERSQRHLTHNESFRLRLTFNGANQMALRRAVMRSLSPARDGTKLLGVPFPAFDSKGRAFVDYETKASAEVPFGWHVLQAQIVGADGVAGVLETSYHVAPLVSFDLVQQRLGMENQPRVVRFGVVIQSNTARKIDGELSVEAPPGWRLISGSGKRFVIYNSRGRVRRVFEVEVPAGATGAFPIRLSAKIGTVGVSQTEWLAVEG